MDEIEKIAMDMPDCKSGGCKRKPCNNDIEIIHSRKPGVVKSILINPTASGELQRLLEAGYKIM